VGHGEGEGGLGHLPAPGPGAGRGTAPRRLKGIAVPAAAHGTG
jgi:hypothetical protein